MTEYVCRVGTAEGRILERVVRAESADSAREALVAEGLEVFGVRRRGGLLGLLKASITGDGAGHAAETTMPGHRPAATGAADRPDSILERLRRPLWRRRRLSGSDLLLLDQELAALVRAGLPLIRCIDILRRRRQGTAPGEILERVRDRVAAGHDLSAAFDMEPSASGIPDLFVTSLRVGEASGDLEGALRRFAGHLERAQELRSRVRGALLYPAALFGVSMVVIAILVGFVLPRFADFYSTYDAELPPLTRFLVGGAAVVQDWGLVVLGIVAVTGIVSATWFSTEDGKAVRDRWALRIPLLGRLRRLYLDLETSRTLATLLAGGAPLLQAVDVAAQGTDNLAYRARLHRVAEHLRQGRSLADAFDDAGLLDEMGLEMVEVGESTGSLEEMLDHVGRSYDEMLERRLETAVGLLEPAVLVSMGVFLATVLLALYLPLFNTVRVIG